jgi:hypothetical protein
MADRWDISDEKAARILVGLRVGKTPRELDTTVTRLKTYCAAHLEYGREALPLIEANNAAAAARKVAAFDLARHRSAEGRRNSETCANGHVRTLENTFYVQNERQCLVRRCKDCNKAAIAKRTPKPDEVRSAVTALHHGETFTTIGTAYSRKLLRNFLVQNPKIGNRLYVLSKKNSDAKAAVRGQSRRLGAAWALMENGGADAYEAIRAATAHLHELERGDVMSLMFVAVAEQRLDPSNAAANVGKFLKIHRQRPRVFGDANFSLDNPVGDDSGMAWLDTKTDADRLWG